MTIKLHVYCGYPNYAESGAKWNDDDWGGNRFVKALKGESFGGYAYIRDNNGVQRRITFGLSSLVFRIFGEWAANKIKEEGIGKAYLVPVPSSSCTTFGEDAKGLKLCNAIAAHHQQATVSMALRWKEAKQSAREGGDRNSYTLRQNLDVNSDLPKDRPIVLVDDVATTHGHIEACAVALENAGHDVRLALAGAQTVWERPAAGIFRIAPAEIHPSGNPFF